MRIGIDARVLERRMTGIGRFLTGLLNELYKLDNTNSYFLFSYQKLNHNPGNYTNIVTGKNRIIPYKVFSPIWTNLILPGYLKKHRIDIFFSVNQLIPVIKNSQIIYFSVIHDVFHKVNKSFHSLFYRKYLDFFLRLTLMKSDCIIAVSDNSKKDIIHFFNVEPEKIKVIYEAADKQFSQEEVQQEVKKFLIDKYGLSERLVLFVGVIENRKNINLILKIADEVSFIDPGIKFLLIGRPGYGAKRILNEVKKRGNVVYLNFVEDNLLRKIYSISSVFLFPSFYEGFGLPPLEAMQTGIPVLASNTSSLKEILDGGAILHSPNDHKSFTEDLLKLFSDKNYFDDWRSKGLAKAKEFNLYDSSKELINIFNSYEKNK